MNKNRHKHSINGFQLRNMAAVFQAVAVLAAVLKLTMGDIMKIGK